MHPVEISFEAIEMLRDGTLIPADARLEMRRECHPGLFLNNTCLLKSTRGLESLHFTRRAISELAVRL